MVCLKEKHGKKNPCDQIIELATKIAAISKYKFEDIIERLKLQLAEGMIESDHIISWNEAQHPPSIICDNCGIFMHENRLIRYDRAICGPCVGEVQSIILETYFREKRPLLNNHSQIKKGCEIAKEVIITPVGIEVQLDDLYLNNYLKYDLLNFSFTTGDIFYVHFHSVGPILFQVQVTIPKGCIVVKKNTSIKMEISNKLM